MSPLRYCLPSKLATWFMDRGWMTCYHALYGIESRIPPCCVAEWVIRNAVGLSPNRWCNMSPRFHAEQYVHCWFHAKLRHESVEGEERKQVVQ